jgi:hypothetical protein
MMSALGHKRALDCSRMMSALPQKADMAQHVYDVRFMPKAEVTTSLDYFVGEAKQRYRKN